MKGGFALVVAGALCLQAGQAPVLAETLGATTTQEAAGPSQTPPLRFIDVSAAVLKPATPLEERERLELRRAEVARPALSSQTASGSRTTCRDNCVGCPGSFCECKTVCDTESTGGGGSGGSSCLTSENGCTAGGYIFWGIALVGAVALVVWVFAEAAAASERCPSSSNPPPCT